MLTGNGPLEIRMTPGEQVVVGDVRVTPVAWALIGRWHRWGFVWARPAALEVERDGQVERVPIVDLMRVVQIGLVAVTVLGGFGAMVRMARARARVRPGG